MDNMRMKFILTELLEESDDDFEGIFNSTSNESSSEDSVEDDRSFEAIFDSTSSSNESSSSEHSVEDELIEHEHPKMNDFMDTIKCYSESDFKSHFRLSRSTVEYLTARYVASKYLPRSSHGGRARIGCEKEIFLYAWYATNAITFTQLGKIFNVTKSSAWTAVRRVTGWLISIGHEFVKWPDSDGIKNNSKKFELIKKIPGVIGVIDSCHINIRTPHVDKESYLDSNHKYSIVLQVVVDADKKFINICCGEEGSLNDSRVLCRSELYQNVLTDEATMFPNNTFILGDSAYESMNWLVPPYKENGALSDVQRAFNYIHSATRIVVKNTFSLLKTRFRSLLHFTEQTDVNGVTNLVMSVCILHNICISLDDMLEEVDDDESNDGEEEIYAGYLSEVVGDRRQILFKYLRDHYII